MKYVLWKLSQVFFFPGRSINKLSLRDVNPSCCNIPRRHYCLKKCWKASFIKHVESWKKSHQSTSCKDREDCSQRNCFVVRTRKNNSKDASRSPLQCRASLAFSGSGFVFSRCRLLLCLPPKGKSHKISMSYKQSEENSDITRSKICKPHCCPICFIQQVLPTGHLSLRRLYFLSPLFSTIVFQISVPGPPVAIRAIKS